MEQDRYGIYVHIPFCSQFCIYCDFYSVKRVSGKGLFLDSLKKEILNVEDNRDKIGDNIDKRGVGTIYFGGGTPSVLTSGQLIELLCLIKSSYRSTPGGIEEVTVEVNPDDITLEYLKELRKGGFNRLSIGVQSFDDSCLKWMNRRHNGEEAVKAFCYGREAGFDNISIDLIFGYAMLPDTLWEGTVKKAISLSPDHISAYQMGIEEGTPLYKLALNGGYCAPEDEVASGQYALLQRMLSDAGYLQYEVSNFSGLGKESRHNSSYWNFTPYLGFGPSAHSFSGACRSWNCSSVKGYIDAINAGKSPLGGSEVLGEEEIFCEFIMLSLRTARGIDKRQMQSRFSRLLTEKFYASVEDQKERGNLVEDDNYIKIPPEKLFVSDGIIRSIYWE